MTGRSCSWALLPYCKPGSAASLVFLLPALATDPRRLWPTRALLRAPLRALQKPLLGDHLSPRISNWTSQDFYSMNSKPSSKHMERQSLWSVRAKQNKTKYTADHGSPKAHWAELGRARAPWEPMELQNTDSYGLACCSRQSYELAKRTRQLYHTL